MSSAKLLDKLFSKLIEPELQQPTFVINHPLCMSPLGMISHKKSLITIFGHKYFRQKFHSKFDIFHVKISTASDFGSYLQILKQNYFKNEG